MPATASRVAEARRHPGRVDHDPRARARRALEHLAHRVGARRIDRLLRAEPRDRLAPLGRGLHHDDVVDAERAQAEERADPDRPGAEHDGAVAGPGLGAGDRVVRDGHRLDQGALHVVDAVGEPEGHALLDDRVLGQPATGRAEPVAERLDTEVVVTCRARCARAARPQRLHRHAVTHADRAHAAPHRDDLARELVPDDERQRRRAHRPDVVLVQVGAAEPVVERADLHLTRPGIRLRDVFDPDVAGAVVQGSSHVVSVLDAGQSAQALSARSPVRRRRTGWCRSRTTRRRSTATRPPGRRRSRSRR